METFDYTAIKTDGGREKGTVVALDLKTAAQEVRQKNLRIITLAISGAAKVETGSLNVSIPKGNFFTRLLEEKISVKTLAVYTSQMGTMLNSGLPINRALEVLARQTENKKLQKYTVTLEKSIEAGVSLSKALQEFPEVFDALYISLVKAGESTGTLGNSLIKMSIFKEREAELKAKIKGAMTYPLIVLGASILIVILLFIFVLPKFVGFLAGMNVPLPLPTKITLGAANFLIQDWYILFGIIVALFLLIRAFLKTENGKTYWDTLLLRMPIIGPLIIKNSMSRFTDTLSTLFGAGVPLVQAMEMTTGTVGNSVIAGVVNNVIDRVKGGEALSQALSKNPYFTPMVIQMAIVGEESGYLEKMLAKVADYYTEEVNTATAGLAAAVNPILMIFVGLIIGWVLISLYLPIFKMAGGIS